MNRLRIFVDFGMSPHVLELLRAGTEGHELVFPKEPVASVLSKAEPDPQFAEVDIAFGQPDVQAIERASRLKWAHISSSGITRYDTPEFREMAAKRGLWVSNSATVYQEACATHLLSFMLAQARHLPAALRSRAASGTPEWNALRYSCAPLKGGNILILGFGAIGGRLVEMLRPFDMEVFAYRRQPRGDEPVPVVTEAGLPQALAKADHVVNILPDSRLTRHFFDSARFAAIKSGAVFYNIGRGSTVDQDALLGALRSGNLAAAWLDVTDPEPLPDTHPLWAEPNCFITPHVAGGHQEETRTLVLHFLENFRRYLAGDPLVDRVI